MPESDQAFRAIKTDLMLTAAKDDQIAGKSFFLFLSLSMVVRYEP